MTLQEILGHFNGVRKLKENSYQCRCPAHDDKRASLTISLSNNGKILICCHAGCDPESILSAVGLTWADIGEGKRSETWKEKLEKKHNQAIQAEYRYTDEKGKYLYSKIRFTNKDMLLGRVIDGEFCPGRGNVDSTLYNLPNTLKAIKVGFPVYIVEGEKDVETLKKIGLPACTAGSVSDWKKEYAPYFRGARAIILPDNDNAGRKLNDTIMRDLKDYAYSVKSVITSEREKGDVSDYILEEEHTKEDLKKLVDSAEVSFAPWLYDNGNETMKPHANLLAETIQRTTPYIRIRHHDDDKEDFYGYKNGVYSMLNKNEVKSIIKVYIPPAMVSDRLLNEVYSLLLCSDDNIHDDLDLNVDQRYINVQNGLYDIETKELKKHSSDILSTIQLKCNYDKAAPKPLHFLKFINDMCTDEDGNIDMERVTVLQEWTGLILSNIHGHKVKKALLLYSALGNTGKSQYLKVLESFVGSNNVSNTPIQELSERFSAGNLYDKRLVMVGDQESGDIANSSMFKQLTGGDVISVEKKHKQSFSFIFRGYIVMACNGLPHFTDDKGSHVFDRLQIIPLTNSIPKDKQDPHLLDKMLPERNGILLWALEGLHRLMENNFKFSYSKICDDQITELRNETDTVFYYLNTNYDLTGNKADRVKRSEFNEDYANWCHENGKTPLKRGNIQERALKNGLHLTTYNGNPSYVGLKRKYPGFTTIVNDEPPF